MGATRASGRNRASRKNLVTAGHCLLEDFDSLNREKTVFILPVSSLEVHGYHLPNDTDMTSAVIMAEESGRLFAGKHADWKVVLLPLLNIGTDELPLPGSIEFSRQTVYRALTEYARSLSRWGFRNLVITNGHGGPKHNLAIDDACRTCNRRYGMRVIAPGIRIFQDFIFGKRFRALEAEMSRKLTAAEKAGLTDLEHAGGWETSIILAENRALVGKNYRAYGSSRIQLGKGVIRLARALEKIVRITPVLRGLMKALGQPLEEGVRFLVTAGKMYDQKKERYTYSGDPSVASPGIGKAWKAAVAKEILLFMEKVFVSGETRPSSVVSNYSAIIFMRRDVQLALRWALAAAIVCAAVISLVKTGILPF
ncbi:MAG TPA: creatininase family protein [Spirochaetota bacterium]|nr:creatininase family protein [Spirochaetota bacterium]HOD13644.1 creatininase family protein [Spirochaetota bacterium]HPG52492.1 creatininase family protein [Spirochaetota bacterium]HPN11666.1 creatininase family protein [Spirochaetota bacterium]